ncbi:Fpg/Nei family DNA glycosylase [Neorhodopirellula pilleata]|uniref:DNA-(apurinic or apyrimidinic site) lyase n=1 Tax=Neorhodopirellula pilleata TaxID=2714738 RepID=A0A5C6ATK0_9BACT|nr:DNA glycosylase [Neorhodopirellula pilleata]TWU03325.1 Endonuclease 8 1 [Neorhodopirellula pilleata]
MPEGHKTHYLASEHNALFAGETLGVSSPQGRFSADAKKIDGCVLASVRAVGKHLFYEFENARIVHVHLGRYGSFAVQDSPPRPPRGQVRMRWIGSAQTLDLRGPTQCRVIDHETQTEICEKLGPDPLSGGKKSDVFAKVSASGKPIGGLLLDQTILAGVGNIFRAEILFEIGMDPKLPGNEIDPSRFNDLWKSMTKMMRVSLKHGRIISVTSKEAGKPLTQLGNDERFRVYGKTHCPRCNGKISQDKIASRKMYFCERCQRGT